MLFFNEMSDLHPLIVNSLILLRQSVLSININLPIRKPLVSMNQSFVYKFFDRAEKSNGHYDMKSTKLLLQMKRSSFIFEEYHVFIEEETFQTKLL